MLNPFYNNWLINWIPAKKQCRTRNRKQQGNKLLLNCLFINMYSLTFSYLEAQETCTVETEYRAEKCQVCHSRMGLNNSPVPLRLKWVRNNIHNLGSLLSVCICNPYWSLFSKQSRINILPLIHCFEL